MAKDAATIKNESLVTGENCTGMQIPRDVSLDFQKKITLSEHERQEYRLDTFLGTIKLYKPLVGTWTYETGRFFLEITEQLMKLVREYDYDFNSNFIT